MTEHKHGEMNIEEQEKIFVKTMNAMAKVAIFSIVLLVFIAIVNG